MLLFYTVGYKSQDQLLLSQQLLLDLGHNIVNMFSKVSIDDSVLLLDATTISTKFIEVSIFNPSS